VEGSARRHRHSGVVAHRMRKIHPDDRAVIQNIPVTSLPLTLLHLAGMLPRPVLERVVIRAARKSEFQVEKVLDLCSRSRGRRGVRALRAIVSRDLTLELRTLSELELRFLQLCRRSGIPDPEINRDVESLMVDAVWHTERVVVELDGYEFHKLPRDLRRDNERNRKLVLAGYKVVRFVWADVVNDATSTAETVMRLLRLTARSGGRR
jgi:very-short-patch-repair endonuclease